MDQVPQVRADLEKAAGEANAFLAGLPAPYKELAAQNLYPSAPPPLKQPASRHQAVSAATLVLETETPVLRLRLTHGPRLGRSCSRQAVTRMALIRGNPFEHPGNLRERCFPEDRRKPFTGMVLPRFLAPAQFRHAVFGRALGVSPPAAPASGWFMKARIERATRSAEARSVLNTMS
jgi:hypothetical protein